MRRQLLKQGLELRLGSNPPSERGVGVRIMGLHTKKRQELVSQEVTPSKGVSLLEICCSVAQSYPTLCDPINCSTPGFPVLHHLPELAQTHIRCVSDAIQPSHPLSSPSPSLHLSQHQGLFQSVSLPHQTDKVLAFQLQRQSFQFRVDFLKDRLD